MIYKIQHALDYCFKNTHLSSFIVPQMQESERSICTDKTQWYLIFRLYSHKILLIVFTWIYFSKEFLTTQCIDPIFIFTLHIYWKENAIEWPRPKKNTSIWLIYPWITQKVILSNFSLVFSPFTALLYTSYCSYSNIYQNEWRQRRNGRTETDVLDIRNN